MRRFSPPLADGKTPKWRAAGEPFTEYECYLTFYSETDPPPLIFADAKRLQLQNFPSTTLLVWHRQPISRIKDVTIAG